MTKEQQIKIQRCIDEFYSNRPQVRDELGGALQVLYEAAPTKHGRWKAWDLTWGRSIYVCTSCGDAMEVPTENGKPIFAYCPNCGARMMDEVEE